MLVFFSLNIIALSLFQVLVKVDRSWFQSQAFSSDSIWRNPDFKILKKHFLCADVDCKGRIWRVGSINCPQEMLLDTQTGGGWRYIQYTFCISAKAYKSSGCYIIFSFVNLFYHYFPLLFLLFSSFPCFPLLLSRRWTWNDSIFFYITIWL